MPNVRPKSPPGSAFPAVLGAARGKVSDFWALAYCSELDEQERRRNPDHETFTFILRYQDAKKVSVVRVPRRLDAIYLQRDGTLLVAGDTRGYLQLTPAGLSEVALPSVTGAFACFWGLSDQHVFAAGSAPPFALYRQHGQWNALILPPDTEDLQAINGHSETDVYFVGKRGQVLHFDGKLVTRVKAPIRIWWLTSIARIDSQRVFIG